MQNGVFENDRPGTPLPQTATTREQSIGEGADRVDDPKPVRGLRQLRN